MSWHCADRVGRAYDPAPYAAVCTLAGIDPGIAWHMGKVNLTPDAC